MIHYDLPSGDYHAHPAISKSGLDKIARSPAHYKSWLTELREETTALRIGTAVHCAVLEPKRFALDYVAAPKVDRRTKDGKAQWEAFETANAGKILLSGDEYATVANMAESARLHPAASELLSEGRAEASVFAELEGVQAKCRPDWLRGDGIVLDLKTTEDARSGAFARSVANYRYHVQHAFYADLLIERGIDVKAFVFVAVEKAPPYGVIVYELDREAVDLGRDLYRRDLALYRHCIAINEWPCYTPNIEPLNIPAWAYAQAA